MGRLKSHLQKKFLAGALAAVPIAVTAFLFWYVDSRLRLLFPGLQYPFIGIPAAAAVVYLLGVFVTSLLGRYLLRGFDWLLNRIPGLRDFYVPWKQIAVTPDGGEGIFRHVVLVPDFQSGLYMLGLTNGQPIPGDPQTLCVYVPGAPNPTTGRLYFIAQASCRFLNMSGKEALKFAVSGGNYVPPAIGANLTASRATPAPHADAAAVSRG